MSNTFFPFSDEQKFVRDTARDFAHKHIAPIAGDIDESAEFPSGTIEKMGEIGFMGIETPEKYGGAGLDTLSYILALEEICKVDASHGVIMLVNNSCYGMGIYKFGTEEQKEKYLKPVASGKAIGAYSLSEQASGSDAGTMRSLASRDGNFYCLKGQKSWVTNGPVADYIIVFMSTQPEFRQKGITAFIVDSNTPNFIRGKTESKLGIRASATCEIIMDNCIIPVANRLGEEGEGFKIAMTILDCCRISVAAQALGIAEAAYEASVIYAREREAFGQKIGFFQGVSFELADVKTRIEASRLLTYNAALENERAKISNERFTKDAAMAKLFSSETAMFATNTALQIHGGVGYSKELPIERFFRDAKITEIYGGTSEIQRLVISRSELGFK